MKFNQKQSGKRKILSFCILLCLLFTFKAIGQIDPLEFPPGHPNVTVTATQQLLMFPLPRYKPGHTLLPNYNVMDPIYFGGYKQPGVSDATAIQNQANIQRELAKSFNYMINVTWFTGAYNDTCVAIANANPQWKVCLMTLRAQVGGTKLWDQNFANDHYLQNSSGQFLDWSGQITQYPYKVWRPTAPVADYAVDGDVVRNAYNVSLANLTRNVDIVNEDGEVYPILENVALQSDPAVVAGKNAAGIGWQPYLARKVRENDNAYRAKFMSHPRMQSAKYTEYRMDGHRDYQLAWEEARYINDPINGQYYATGDLYVRWPYNWQNWVSAWHGLRWVSESRHYEITFGDKLFSPFVAAGWDANPENDVRPAQWLGLMKVMGMYGAEFYYTSYFTESLPANDPKGYAWQAVIPPYSQALSSRYEDIMRNGSLLAGDMTNNLHYAYGINTPIPFYQFNTGASNKVVIIRKKDGANKYAITGTIQNNSNTINSTPLTSTATFTLNGQSLTVNIRRHGSTFIYDNTVPSAPVFYQLDGWHESKHPWYWSKDFNMEAELYDNTNATYNLKTTVPAGTPSGNYTNFTSYITFPDAQSTFTPIEYNFSPRDASVTSFYLWVKLRSRVNGSTTGLSVNLDNGTSKTIGCVSDTVWKWYKLDAVNQQVILYNNLTLANHTLRITPTNSKLEIDQIVLTANPNLNLTPVASPCTAGCTASISAGGPTTFCQGGNVVLTANSGMAYLWSTGATTQSVTITASGNYTVNVTQSGGCSNTSSPVSVTVNNNPTATITASGPTTFCQGENVTLTASSGTSYMWSNGATMQSISVNTAGNYAVTVTNGSCSATSAIQAVTVNSNPVPAITAGGSTTFCQGGNLTLTASTGNAYLWNPNGEITQTINVNSTGNYSVRVTYANGCSSTSSPTAVTVISNPVAIIAPSGPTTFCQGDDVTLTANSADSYIWSTGETTQSITTATSGNYTVQITVSGGCSATSSPTVVTVIPNTDATITANGPTTFCQGGNVILTASSGNSYMWSTGATTQAITVTTSGNYVVTVGQTSGCTSTSPITNVNVVAAGFQATITAGGPTSFCQGGSVILSANPSNGISYLWMPFGETTQTITATKTGNYTVKVTVAGGCSKTSAMLPITVSNCTCPIPTGLFATNVTTLSATLNWTPVTGVDSLQVRLRDMTTNAVYITGAFPGYFSDITVGAGPNIKYRWKIRSKCGNNNWTQWSPFGVYKTPSARISGQDTTGKITKVYNDLSGNFDSNEPVIIDPSVKLELYPNPTNGTTNVIYYSENKTKIILKVTTISGELLLKEKHDAFIGANIYIIDLRMYPDGIYIVIVDENNNVISKKLVKATDIK